MLNHHSWQKRRRKVGPAVTNRRESEGSCRIGEATNHKSLCSICSFKRGSQNTYSTTGRSQNTMIVTHMPKPHMIRSPRPCRESSCKKAQKPNPDQSRTRFEIWFGGTSYSGAKTTLDPESGTKCRIGLHGRSLLTRVSFCLMLMYLHT